MKFKKSLEDIDFPNVESADISLGNVYLENGLATYSPKQNRFSFVPKAKEEARKEKMRILLNMSEEFHKFVKRYHSEPEELIQRACVSRAYYSLFFAVRALILWKRDRDPGVGEGGHARVKQFLTRLKAEGSGYEDLDESFERVRRRRVQADYKFFVSDSFKKKAGKTSLTQLNAALKPTSDLLEGAGYSEHINIHRPN